MVTTVIIIKGSREKCNGEFRIFEIFKTGRVPYT